MPEFVAHALDLKMPLPVIFEVGSMDGADAFYFKSVFPNSKVIAIEALPENCLVMAGKPGIVVINTVINNYDGQTLFHRKNINGIHSIFDRGEEYGTDIAVIPCKRLDTLCKELDITAIDMIKIDVEGASMEILEGMGDLLSTIKIMHIETESHEFFAKQRLHADVVRTLSESGMEMIDITSGEIYSGCYQYDSVWVRR